MKNIILPLISALFMLALTGCPKNQQVPTGELFVMTEPADAVVEINDKILGMTPLQDSKVPSGKLLVTIRKEGFETEWHTLFLATDDRQVLESTLRPITGLVLINSNPQGAAVSLGEVFVGTTPYTTHQISRGTHRARLVLSGFNEKEIEFSVNDRIPQMLNVDLTSNAGTMIIHSNPTGATAFVDGRNEGVTPLSLNRIGEGEREVTLQFPGFENYRRNILVAPSATARVDAILTPLPGGLSVVSIPNGARVYVNGEFKGDAPINIQDIAPGVQSVRVEMRGHADIIRTVDVGRGQRVVEEFELERNSGTLQIVTRPAGVNVNINGEFMGTTVPGSNESDVVSRPLIIDMLSKGSHTLQLVREGYTFETKRFFITQDEVTALDEILERKFIPNVILRIDNSPDGAIIGVLQRRHFNGDVELEISKGVFRTFPKDSFISLRPLKQEEKLEDIEAP